MGRTSECMQQAQEHKMRAGAADTVVGLCICASLSEVLA